MIIKKKIIKIIILGLLFFNCANSQNINQVIDSLKTELNKKLPDKIRAKYYGDLTWYYKLVSVDSSLKYGGLALKMIQGLGDEKMLAQQYSDLGAVYLQKGDFDTSKRFFYKGLAIRKSLKDTLGQAKIYTNLAAVYQNLKDVDSAMFINLKSLKVYEKLKLFNYANIVKSNIANLYSDLNQFEKSVKYNYEVIAYTKQKNNLPLLGRVYTNLGNAYLHSKDTVSAVESYKKSIKITRETGDMRTLGNALNSLGAVYTFENKVNEAVQSLEESLKIREEFNSDYDIAATKLSLSINYVKYNNLVQAKKYADECLSYFEQNNIKDKLVLTYFNLIVIYAYENNLEKVNYYSRLFDITKNVIATRKANKDVAELETKYQTQKKRKELLEVKAAKIQTELELSKKTILMYSFLGGSLLLLFGGYTLFQRNKRKHESEKHLAIVREKESGMQAIIMAEEKERSRIAKELHDGIVQDIGSVILGWRDTALDVKSKELLNRLENTNSELRNVSHQLMPRALEELGLISALEDLLANSLKYVNIEYTFEHFNIKNRLPSNVETTVYRVGQELVNNIIKHSEATEVSFQLFQNKGSLIFIVEDDGSGITSQKKLKKGIGLLNIKNRLAVLHGSVNFEPSENSGTLVTVKIPL